MTLAITVLSDVKCVICFKICIYSKEIKHKKLQICAAMNDV